MEFVEGNLSYNSQDLLDRIRSSFIVSFRGLSEKLNYFHKYICYMNRFFAIIKGIFHGDASVEYIEKTRVSKVPGDVTDLVHN